MSAASLERLGSLYRVTFHAQTLSEAMAIVDRGLSVVPEAYAPTPTQTLLAEMLADQAGLPRGEVTHYVEQPDIADAPPLSPEVEALQERAEADDPHVGGLKAGEAYDAPLNLPRDDEE